MALSAPVGVFLCFAATVLLVFVSISAPTWNAISFLDANVGGRSIHFGVFGFTGSGTSVGYRFPPDLLGFNDTRLNSTTIHNLTKLLILHPIAAVLAGIATLLGLCGSRLDSFFMALFAALAFVVTAFIWIIDMVLWGIARSRIRGEGGSAQFGNANFLTLGAAIALAIGACAALIGVVKGRRRARSARHGSY